MEPMTLTEDRIAVVPDAPDETKSGDLIKINAKAKTRGTVLMCGPGVYNALLDKLAPMYVKPGDVIMYARFTGGEIEIDGQTCLLMRQCDVLSIVRKTASDDQPEVMQKAFSVSLDVDTTKTGFADEPETNDQRCRHDGIVTVEGECECGNDGCPVVNSETGVPTKDVSDALNEDDGSKKFKTWPHTNEVVVKSGFADNDEHNDLAPHIPDVIPPPPPVSNVPCTNNACHGSMHYVHECPYRDGVGRCGDSGC